MGCRLLLLTFVLSLFRYCSAAAADAYTVLGLTKEATQPEIRRAYRKLSLKHHPDKNPGDDDAAARFRRINDAYEQIGDEDARTLYDAYGAEEFNNQWEFQQAQRMGKIKKMQGNFYKNNDFIKNIEGRAEFDTVINVEAGLFGGAVLIEFYAPWCVHCQHMMPEFKKTAALLEGVAGVAAVNCESKKNKKWCSRYPIQGFPTLQLFSRTNDISGENYEGNHDAQEIFRWVKQMLDPSLITLTAENFPSEVMESDAIWLVDFSAGSWCPPCTGTKAPMREIAMSLKGLVKVGIINCDEEKALCDEHDVPHYPYLALFPRNKASPVTVLDTGSTGGYPQVKLLRDFSKISQALLNDVLIERYQSELPPKLTVLFKTYESDRVSEIPELMKKWKGRERHLWANILEEYNITDEDISYLFEEKNDADHMEL